MKTSELIIWNPSEGGWHPSEGGILYLCIACNGIPPKEFGIFQMEVHCIYAINF